MQGAGGEKFGLSCASTLPTKELSNENNMFMQKKTNIVSKKRD